MAEAAASSTATSSIGLWRPIRREWPATAKSPFKTVAMVPSLSMWSASMSKRFMNRPVTPWSSGSETRRGPFMEVGREQEKRRQVSCSVCDNGIHSDTVAGTPTATTRRRRCGSSVQCWLSDASTIDHTTSGTGDSSDATTAVVISRNDEEGGGGVGRRKGAAAVAEPLSLESLDGSDGRPGLVGRGFAHEVDEPTEITATASSASANNKAKGTLLLASVALVMSLCNADRVVMSVAVMPLAAAHSWSSSFLGIIQSSFLWGYVISSAVGGALADRYGGKRVMAGGVALWSLATLLTPWAAGQSTAVLLAVRAMFGLAEGVAIPAMNIILSRSFPSSERASAVGLSMAGFHMGNVVGFLLSPILLARLGVFGPFALFAAVGFLWLLLCLPAIPNQGHHAISTETVGRSQQHRPPLRFSTVASSAMRTTKSGSTITVRRLLSEMPSWAIIFANVTNNWGYFVLLSWMPVYFKTVFDVKLKEAAWFSAIPWALMAVSGYIAGLSSDHLIKSGYQLTLVRKIMQSIGFIGPGIALMCLNYAKTPSMAAALLTVALSLSSFSQAGFLLNMQDIAPDSAGLLHGIANSFGTVAAIISTIGTGYFVQWLGSFQAFLTLTSFLYFFTAVFWCLHATADQVFF